MNIFQSLKGKKKKPSEPPVLWFDLKVLGNFKEKISSNSERCFANSTVELKLWTEDALCKIHSLGFQHFPLTTCTIFKERSRTYFYLLMKMTTLNKNSQFMEKAVFWALWCSDEHNTHTGCWLTGAGGIHWKPWEHRAELREHPPPADTAQGKQTSWGPPESREVRKWWSERNCSPEQISWPSLQIEMSAIE